MTFSEKFLGQKQGFALIVKSNPSKHCVAASMARRFYLLVVGNDEVLGIEEWLGFEWAGRTRGRDQSEEKLTPDLTSLTCIDIDNVSSPPLTLINNIQHNKDTLARVLAERWQQGNISATILEMNAKDCSLLSHQLSIITSNHLNNNKRCCNEHKCLSSLDISYLIFNARNIHNFGFEDSVGNSEKPRFGGYKCKLNDVWTIFYMIFQYKFRKTGNKTFRYP